MFQTHFMPFLLVFFVCTAMQSTNSNNYSTTQGQIKMTLALAVTNSTGINKKAKSTLNVEANTVKFSMQIRDFGFDNYLVENAFEESYLEASKYPEASFEGKFKTAINWKIKTVQKIDVTGHLTLHGVKKARNFTANVSVLSATQVKVASDFVITAKDYKIDIAPSMFASGKDEIPLRLEATYLKQ